MGLAITLNNALSGLNVSQQSLTVLSQNIANANTPGYSRQIISQQPVYLDGIPSGVSINEITRQVDDFLERSVRSQNAVTAQAITANSYADRIQLLFGQPGD